MPTLTPEQELFATTVRQVAVERIAPIGARMEATDEFPHDLLQLFKTHPFVKAILEGADGEDRLAVYGRDGFEHHGGRSVRKKQHRLCDHIHLQGEWPFLRRRVQ